jgi:CDK-activating kinase assembly factor MAT1
MTPSLLLDSGRIGSRLIQFWARRFNRREDEFDSLRAYNDYLNDVEDISYNLIYDIDVAATRAKLESYERSNQEAIRENRELERMGANEEKARQAADVAQARKMRIAALKEDEEERRERVAARQDVIKQLAEGDGDAITLALEGERALLDRAHTRQPLPSSTALNETANGSSLFSIRGLKKRVKAEPEKPYDPFAGLLPDANLFAAALPAELNVWDDFLGKVRKDEFYTAGGYDVREFYSRMLCDAYSGIGVFVSEEMAQKDHEAVSEVATAGAAIASTADTTMLDVS